MALPEWSEIIAAKDAEIASLTAEVERLRAALEWIVGCALTEPQAMTDKARAALKETRT
jgi:hypothetical protein